MKMAVLWYVESCSLVEVQRLFIGAYCERHDNGGSKQLTTTLNIAKESHIVFLSVRQINFYAILTIYVERDFKGSL